MNIYVASSWRNNEQQDVVAALREAGHTVYDFKNPGPKQTGFSWGEISVEWDKWSPAGFRDALQTPRSQEGFNSDFNAMQAADACVLVLPCGRSAHLEAGYFVGAVTPSGAKKRLIILLEDKATAEPELMYLMADAICLSLPEVVKTLAADVPLRVRSSAHAKSVKKLIGAGLGAERQTGRSHEQIIDLLAGSERHVSYIVQRGSSAGYYLAIACQILWASKMDYAVDHQRRIVTFDNRIIAFKEDQDYYHPEDRYNQGVAIVFDHAALEARHQDIDEQNYQATVNQQNAEEAQP